MLDFTKLKEGEILSEASYFTITKVLPDGAEVKDSHGNEGIEIGKDYLKNILFSADQFDKIEKVNQTILIQTVLENARIACSIYFKKQDKVKTRKAYLQEIEDQANEVQANFLANGINSVKIALQNPISKIIPGDMRLIKGYHAGTQDERGRINFIDMEDNNTLKGVDPRTIEYAIVNNIKYTLK